MSASHKYDLDSLDSDTVSALNDPEFAEFVEQFKWGSTIDDGREPNTVCHSGAGTPLASEYQEDGYLPGMEIEESFSISRLKDACAAFPLDREVLKLLKDHFPHKKSKFRDRRNEARVKKVLAKLAAVGKLQRILADLGLVPPVPSNTIKRI